MGLADLEEARGPKSKYPQSHSLPEAFKKNVFLCFQLLVTPFLLHVL